MQIEAGKFYTTRSGKKRGPIANTLDNPFWPFKCGGYYFKSDGFSCPGNSAGHRDAEDLIAEWVEPAAERKPKAGDRVVIAPGAIGYACDLAGKTVEVCRVKSRDYGDILYFKNESREGRESCLIDGEWEFAPEFKAGDRVVNVDDECPCGDITIGREYVLTGAYENSIDFRDDAGDDRTRLARNYRAATVAAAPVTNPDATSVPGDIVAVVAGRYDAVPVGSLGRVTGAVKSGRHVRMCDDGLSYVFALDEIAMTDAQPEFEYEAGSTMGGYGGEFDTVETVGVYESDLRDDIAAETLAQIIENEGADIRTAAKHAATAYAYADAMIAARAA
jgi:hypothetical protein